MLAITVPTFGGPDVLRAAELPVPAPGPGQVLIAVESAGVGYVDVMARAGDYAPLAEPGFVPGLEAAGTVTATGDDVDPAWTGRRVYALTWRGAYAEQVVADLAGVVPLPTGVDAETAVALGVNALVARTGLRRAGVQAGERVLVRGAGGGIGVHAVQLAAAAGSEVTAVTSSAERGARLRELGAAHVQDRATARESADAYDVVVDTVAGPELGHHLGRLRANGRYVLCGGAGGAPSADAFDAIMTGFHRSPTLIALSLNSLGAAELAAAAAELFAPATTGELRGIVDERFPLADAHRAHERLEATPVFGRLTLHP
ncbi:zinc-binding dehydrogenase [Saccharopolyspora sp. NPDC047091]|uniref:quinone oxidoreductase family protein n=1 Tax=Saccharopolyspora sp. NPDC047091 TaxID=3155924 RepID=UPI0033F843AA